MSQQIRRVDNGTVIVNIIDRGDSRYCVQSTKDDHQDATSLYDALKAFDDICREHGGIWSPTPMVDMSINGKPATPEQREWVDANIPL